MNPEEMTPSEVIGVLTGSPEDLTPSRFRVSRPCYDKFRRCPGWAGGGTRYAKVRRCDGGYIRYYAEERERLYLLWQWRVYRCPKCRVFVLPYMIRWADPAYWWRWKRRDLARWADDQWPRYIPENPETPWEEQERVPLRTFLFSVLIVAPAYRLWDVEWDENWRAWPHCCTQAGCWMHVNEPSCRCGCRWCALARRIRR